MQESFPNGTLCECPEHAAHAIYHHGMRYRTCNACGRVLCPLCQRIYVGVRGQVMKHLVMCSLCLKESLEDLKARGIPFPQEILVEKRMAVVKLILGLAKKER